MDRTARSPFFTATARSPFFTPTARSPFFTATARSRFSTATVAATIALQQLVLQHILGTVLTQPDVVERGCCLRHWHDRPPGSDLALYRTPGFAQRLGHSVANPERLPE